MAGKTKEMQEIRRQREIPAALLAATFLCAFFLFREECVRVLQWYGAWLLLSAAALPLALALFPSFSDGGYIFSKPLGLLITGGMVWTASVFRILPFARWNTFLSAGVCFCISAAVFRWRSRKTPGGVSEKIREGRAAGTDRIAAALYTELFFFILLAYWLYIKANNPAAYGTEKMMDFGLMASMDKSPYSPAQDMWFSGASINYYYVGQFLATFVTKLSGVGVNYGYNLMMMTLPALGFLECFCIVRQLLRSWMEDRQDVSESGRRWIPVLGGTVAGFADTFAGNMHYVLYALLKVPTQKEGAYYYPDSTRFIGYNPDVADKTIHEFPSYSFLIGDLHAHVLNYVFVLTVAALLLSWTLQRKSRQERRNEMVKANQPEGKKQLAGENQAGSQTAGENQTGGGAENVISANWLARLKEIALDALGAEVLLIGIFLGMFQGINYWDFPIYYTVSGAIILFANIRLYRNARRVIEATAIQGAFILAVAWLAGTPFRIHFQMIASHIHLTTQHSTIYQLAVLWALPIALSLSFCGECFAGFLENKAAQSKKGAASKGKILQRLRLERTGEALSTFFGSVARRFMELRTEDLFILLLALCAMGLILAPEFVYVEDIYGEAYQRANTMFKLTYQSYILFSLCFGYMLLRLIAFSKTRRRVAWIMAFLLALTLGYFHNAAGACFGGVFGKAEKDRTQRWTLDATAFMDELTQADNVAMKDDAEAIRWINENVKGYPAVILEADGDSYTFAGRISVFTGYPTILGWRTHEWLWRSDPDNPKQYPPEISERDADIRTIYTSGERDKIVELLKKYDVDYVVIGYQERHKGGVWGESYEGTLGSEELLKGLGEIVFQSEQNEGEPLYVIQLDKSRY